MGGTGGDDAEMVALGQAWARTRAQPPPASGCAVAPPAAAGKKKKSPAARGAEKARRGGGGGRGERRKREPGPDHGFRLLEDGGGAHRASR